ncbi:hypothetical protein BK731_18795 [Bacillus thuringiensis serovar muju]|nr:hypothetical protein [Bacillus thuringiensis]MBH0348005.1 hypothetical protein [Bacillus thuringiensis]OTY03229.1 hypothetical protein BK731_18795 [Bacillus thuringiensis serovar muju]
MKTVYKIFSLVVIAVLLVSCNSSENTTSNENTNKTNEKSEQTKEQTNPLVGTSFKLTSDNALSDFQYTFKLDNNTFKPAITIANQHPEDMEYKLFFLIDYKEAPFSIPNKKKQTSIDFKIKANEQKNLDITFSDIPNGRHDVLAILIRRPNDYLKNNHYYSPDNFMNIRRLQLIVKDDVVPKTPEFTPAQVDTNSIEISNELVFVTEQEKFTKYEDALGQIKKSSLENLWLHFNATKDEKFVVVPLIDYKVNEHIISERFLYAQENSDVSLKLNFKNTDLPKSKNNINILVIKNPFERIENESGPLKNPDFWDIKKLNRVQIE